MVRRILFGLFAILACGCMAACDVGLADTACLVARDCPANARCVQGQCVPADATDAGVGDATRCGDGVVDDGEACDDGDDNDDRVPDACRADCTLPTCGDSVVDPAFDEACDDGEDNDDASPNACRTDCTLPACGDGVVDPAFDEACDPAVDGIRCQVDCEVYYESLCDACTGIGTPCGTIDEDMRCLAEAAPGSVGVCAPECETAADCPLGRDCLFSAEVGLGVCLLVAEDCRDCDPSETCDDGVDNDCDGDRDCDDADCDDAPACRTEVCDNAVDDDGDGDVDCDDADCAAHPACDVCAPDFVAGEGSAVWTGTVAGVIDLPTALPCAPLADRGFLVDLEVPTAGRWRIDTAGSDARMGIAVADVACGTRLGECSDQASLAFFGSLYLDLTANEIVSLVLAPLEGTASDAVVLNAWPDEADDDRCSNGLDDDGDGQVDCDDPRCSSVPGCLRCSDDTECGEGVCQSDRCACLRDTADAAWCGGECIDLDNDPFHCGACDRVCPTFACSDAECVSAGCTNPSDREIVTDPDFEDAAGRCFDECGLSATSFACVARCFDAVGLTAPCRSCMVGNGLCALIFCHDACTDPGAPACAPCMDAFCQPALETCVRGPG